MALASLGEFYIETAFVLSFFGVLIALIAGRRESRAAYVTAQRLSGVLFFCLTLAAGLLVYAYMADIFKLKAVYGYSDIFLSWPYKLAAIYAGQTGSLLFWAFILSIFVLIHALEKHKTGEQVKHHAYSLSLAFGVTFFFLLLLAFVERPFLLMPGNPADGRGMNPILQNPAMLFHPPTLYLGYISFTIPFAYALGAVISRRPIAQWLDRLRLWVLISWFFLGIGNLLGAWWAYVELGWGGFWGWDPVENASLMPWLLQTALLHGLILQKRGGYFPISNLLLVVATFVFTILGTFITRSGLIESVHAYAFSQIGWYFLAFLLLALIFGVVWVIFRSAQYKGRKLENYFSREAALLALNLLLAVSVFFILFGVFLPTLSKQLIGVKISAAAEFFSSGMAPVGCLMLLLLGVGLEIHWRPKSLKRPGVAFIWPLAAFAVTALSLFLWARLHWYAVFSLALCVFSLVVLLRVVLDDLMRAKSSSAGYLRFFTRRKIKYASLLIHLSVLMFFLGFAGTYFKQEKEVNLGQGDKTQFAGYQVQLENVALFDKPEKQVLLANLMVTSPGGEQFVVSPSREYFRKHEQPVSEIAVRARLLHDFYVILGDVELDKKRAGLKLVLNPFISWLWLGGTLMFGASLILIFIPRRKGEEEE